MTTLMKTPAKEREEYKKLLKEQLMEKIGTAQAVLLLQKTPRGEVRKRLMNPQKPKGPGNPEFSYLEHAYVEETLNYAFMMDWDAVVTKSERIGNEVMVEGYLEVRFKGGAVVRKTGFGGAHYIEANRNQTWGDAFKAAYSDMIKNAATKLGLGLDLYRTEEAIREKVELPPHKPQEVRSEQSDRLATEEQKQTIIRLGGVWTDGMPYAVAAAAIRELAMKGGVKK